MIDIQSKRKNAIIAILIILLLALIGFSTYLMFFKENNIISECKDIKEDNNKEVDLNNKIEIYGKKYDSGAYFVCNHKDESDCNSILFTIETETSNANIIHLSLLPDNYQYIAYYDNGVKLYNVKDESISKLDINLNGNIEWVDEGYIYNGKDEAYYYSIKDNKRVYEKYDEIYPVEDINDKSFTNGLKYLYGKKGNNANIIDFKTGNVILTIDISDYEGAGFKKDGSYIIASLFGVEDENNIIYNAKGEKIFDLKDNQLYEINGSKLTIYEYSKTKVKEY